MGGTIRNLLYVLDERVNLVVILFLFWALFWGLNGGDKFFESTSVPNTAEWAASGVIVENDVIVGAIHPREPVGGGLAVSFGVLSGLLRQ